MSSTSSLKTAKAFKAIIYANENYNSLYPYHENPPPALLPILTKPLLQYQIELLERSGFDQCIVLCSLDFEEKIASFIEEYKGDTGSNFGLRLCVTNESCHSVCDGLRQVTMKGAKNRIVLDCDFLVLPCDVISTESLTKFLAYHHFKRATMTMMLTQPPPIIEDEFDTKNKKSSKKKSDSNILIDPRLEDAENPLYVGLDPEDSRLCFLREIDEDVNRLQLHKDILRRMQSFTLYTNLRSPSIYIFSREALQLLHEYEDIESLDVLAQFLVGMQFVQGNPRYNKQSEANVHFSTQHLEQKTSLHSTGSNNTLDMPSFQRNASYLNGSFYFKSGPKNNNDDDIINNNSTTDVAVLNCFDNDQDSIGGESTYVTAAAHTTYTKKTNKKDKEDEEFQFSIPRLACYAFIPPSSSLIIRCDNLLSYSFLNKKLSQPTLPTDWTIIRPLNHLQDIQATLVLAAKSAQQQEQQPNPEQVVAKDTTQQQGNNNKNQKKGKQQVVKKEPITGWFAEDSLWEDGAIITNSIIGRHCRVGKNAIVRDSILMDYSSIGDNAKVEATIIGTRGKVLKDVEVKNDAIAVETEVGMKKTF